MVYELGGTLQIVTIWYINIHKWYGTLPIKQPRGLLIQGWHYHAYCSRVIGLQELTDWDAHPSEVLVEVGLKKLFILDKVFRSPKKQKHTPLTIQVFSKYWTGKNPKNHCACSLMPGSRKPNRLWPNQLRSPPFSNPFQIALLCDRRRSTPDLRLPRKLKSERSSEVWGSPNFCHGLMVLNGI